MILRDPTPYGQSHQLTCSLIKDLGVRVAVLVRHSDFAPVLHDCLLSVFLKKSLIKNKLGVMLVRI